jgi:hypothetical protein
MEMKAFPALLRTYFVQLSPLLNRLGAVSTYDSASESLSDLHANRIPKQFSVRFPVRHKATPILEIVDELNFSGISKFRETHILTAKATG